MHNVQVRVHRKLPQNALIKTAWLQLVRRKATHWDLELCLTCELPVAQQRAPGVVVGVDTGFRAVDADGGGSLRVASLSDGRHVETPRNYRSMLAQVERLRALADTMSLEFWAHNFGAVPLYRDRPWTARRIHREIMGGSYVRPQIDGRDASRRWQAGDRSFEVYRLQHKHLTEWATALDEKARRKRKEAYRTTAAELAREYDVIAVEKLRIDNMARSRVAGGNRSEAAPSELRSALKNAALTHGAQLLEVPAMFTSQTCSVCGNLDADARAGLVYTCSRCGLVSDADTNAARNIASAAMSTLGVRALADRDVPANATTWVSSDESFTVAAPAVAAAISTGARNALRKTA